MSTRRQVVRVGAEEAALFLSKRAGIHVGPRALLKWAALQQVPCLRLVGRYAFDLNELAVWLDAGRVSLEATRPSGGEHRLLA